MEIKGGKEGRKVGRGEREWKVPSLAVIIRGAPLYTEPISQLTFQLTPVVPVPVDSPVETVS